MEGELNVKTLGIAHTDRTGAENDKDRHFSDFHQEIIASACQARERSSNIFKRPVAVDGVLKAMRSGSSGAVENSVRCLALSLEVSVSFIDSQLSFTDLQTCSNILLYALRALGGLRQLQHQHQRAALDSDQDEETLPTKLIFSSVFDHGPLGIVVTRKEKVRRFRLESRL